MIKVSSPPKFAAGFQGIKYALKNALGLMSPLKSLKLLRKLNQKDGIDCPGCAWPDPNKRSKLGEFCENGVKAIAEEATDKHIDVSFFVRYSLKELKQKSDYWLGKQGRLISPVVFRKGNTHYESITWDSAFEMIGNELKSLDNPHEAVFYTSGRTSNEAAFLYQLFVRKFGTNNLPDCSNMCHESSGVGLNNTLGIGKGSVTLEDFEHAEVILIFGQNPGTNHPRMLNALEKAKQKGTKIIVINPLKEVALSRFKNPQKLKGWIANGTEIADLFLQIKINEDVALLKVWLKMLIEGERKNAGILDMEFIGKSTKGFSELKSDLERYDLQKLMNRTGISHEKIKLAADWLSSNKRIIACWAMGLTQHVNGVDNIQEIVNLLLLKGSIGKRGSGTCPVRGHSNVQGDRTMGIMERPTKKWIDNLRETFHFDPPTSPGYNVVESISAMSQNKVGVFMALGGNFLAAAPDTPTTARGLGNCKLTVSISTKLNRTHLATGATSLILPCLGRTDKLLQKSGEQFLTVENSMGVVHSTRGILNPPSPMLKSEPEIIASIASTTIGNDNEINWLSLVDDYNNIRDLISKAVSGFDAFNEKLKNGNGFSLPNGARAGIFNTPDKKALFSINQLPKKSGYKYTMMTIRSHDQFNTTVYGLDDRYRGIFDGRMVVFMNPNDIEKEKIKPGVLIGLYNSYDGAHREVNGFQVVSYSIPEGCLATYFPEANPLVPLSLYARKSHTPSYKSVGVNIKK